MGISIASPREQNNMHFNFSEAYFKIDNIRMENTRVSFELIGFPDITSRNYYKTLDSTPMPHEGNGRIVVKYFSVEMDKLTIPQTSADETIEDVVKKSIYMYIKSLPDYANAVDVL